jgi:hypothetical protein
MNTFWLDFVNIALGLVTLLCLLAVLVGVGYELVYRLHGRTEPQDDRLLSTPELGRTMTDGGERLDRTRDGDHPKADG